MYRTLVDFTQPRLVPADMPLFAAALADLFPGMQAQATSVTPLRAAIEAELLEAGLQVRHRHCYLPWCGAATTLRRH